MYVWFADIDGQMMKYLKNFTILNRCLKNMFMRICIKEQLELLFAFIKYNIIYDYGHTKKVALFAKDYSLLIGVKKSRMHEQQTYHITGPCAQIYIYVHYIYRTPHTPVPKTIMY